MLALLAATTEFAAAKPWELMADCDLVGLTDPKTEETRLATVLGNGGEVFGAVIYRRATGLHWILNTLDSLKSCTDMEVMEGMDCLKVEMVSKRELVKVELDLLNQLNFKPSGKGLVWPQFQSTAPGWMPWHIDQTEAEQLLADLPRLTKFHDLFRRHPELYKNHMDGKIPMLPNPMPDRPLVEADIEWRSFLSLPTPHQPFRASAQQLTQLRSLERVPKASCEYGCKIMPGAVVENGRPCFGRVSLLVEHQRGLVLGYELSLATAPLPESVGLGLVNTLVKNGFLPGKLLIDDLRLEPILQPFCAGLQIKLLLAYDLGFLTEAMDSLGNFMQNSQR